MGVDEVVVVVVGECDCGVEIVCDDEDEVDDEVDYDFF